MAVRRSNVVLIGAISVPPCAINSSTMERFFMPRQRSIARRKCPRLASTTRSFPTAMLMKLIVMGNGCALPSTRDLSGVFRLQKAAVVYSRRPNTSAELRWAS
eukprot:1373958-Prymnesium_polylepis.2